MVKIVGNLKKLIDKGTADYISLHSEEFKSTTPGPMGPDGPRGPQGVGVHHMKGTSTTDSEGDFSTAGELDTYTFYADANEELPLAWFTVKNGEDPWRRAIDRGYRGTEEEFYTTLASIEEYATIALESIDITEENKQIVLAAATQVAADRIVVEDARDIAVEKSEIAKESADIVQIIFLGAKSVDPVVDNQGNPLVVGTMYYNDVIGQLKLWDGTEWTTAAFSAEGAVFSFNGRTGAVALTDSDVTIAVGKNLSDAIKYSESDKVLTDVNKVNLSTDTSLVASAGQITWNPNERTADIGLDNNVVLQVGQEMLALVRNGTASSIPDGTVVMLTGSIGNSGKLVVAPYDGVADASLILGIATETIASNADGFVTSYGKIRGIDTSMWSDGDALYTNGSGLATTPPAGLNMKIAAVVHSHTNGTLMVRVNGYSQVKEW